MAVRLEDISHRFGRSWALKRLTLEIPTGACVLLTGENGAGKTTLLRVLSTAIRPTRGEVFLFGKSVRTHLDQVRSRLGLVTHQNYLYDTLSARENLELTARLSGIRAPRARIDALLAHVGLARHAARRVGGFSAGMKRRLCFGRLLLTHAELALLDEPFAALDPAGVALVERLIRELVQQGATALVSTHDVDRGKALCDSHLILAGGRQRGGIEPLPTVGAGAGAKAEANHGAYDGARGGGQA